MDLTGCDLADKTILLTGGTGSFGHAFVQRVLRDHPTATIRIFSRDELKQWEMRERFRDDRLRFFIGDIRNKTRLYRAMQGADIVVHAAAMKQVPACEYNPFEAVQTNILGGQHVVDCAIDAGVEKVVALSTDKAVNPVNLYGATKLCAEKIVVRGNTYASRSATRLACVRYGNVVGSRGSVIPVFQRQKAEQGRLTI
ncbi:MAG: polysaccharide biosynthesis protein, partial [Acidimicrobiales bacterium]|nr:polysaccharide biosynthesis protein [Acidimicrobiales bacterium]